MLGVRFEFHVFGLFHESVMRGNIRRKLRRISDQTTLHATTLPPPPTFLRPQPTQKYCNDQNSSAPIFLSSERSNIKGEMNLSIIVSVTKTFSSFVSHFSRGNRAINNSCNWETRESIGSIFPNADVLVTRSRWTKRPVRCAIKTFIGRWNWQKALRGFT